MEVDPKKFRDLATAILESLRELETEIMAYRLMIHIAQQAGFLDADVPVEASLESARHAPSIAKLMADKYDPLLEGVKASLDRADTEEAFAKLFREWKPSGPPN